jgi:6-phosphogluconolactonase (cycloisomerase 2 family)
MIRPTLQGLKVGKQGARFAYVGTYTQDAPGGWSEAAEVAPPQGVCVFRVLPNGNLELMQTVKTSNPAFLLCHPGQQVLYVMNERSVRDGKYDGSIEAYAIDDVTGELSFINRISSLGSIPAHMDIDPIGKVLVLANYGSGTIVAIQIDDDGSLGAPLGMLQNEGCGPNAIRQEMPHPHSVRFDPSGKYIASADLGTDRISILSLSETGFTKVSEIMVSAGSGPRQLAFNPDGKFLYVLNEIAGSVTGFAFDSRTGSLGKEIQTIRTYPDYLSIDGEKSAAEILVHPTGKFLYASNRRVGNNPMADSVTTYRIDPVNGTLTLIGYITTGIAFPRTINFDLSGCFLYVLNQKGDSIVRFAINQITGELSPTDVNIQVKVPVSIIFVK